MGENHLSRDGVVEYLKEKLKELNKKGFGDLKEKKFFEEDFFV